MEIKRLSFRHKNNKLFYYTLNYLRQLIHSSFYQRKLEKKLKSISKFEEEKIINRLNYYNQLTEFQHLDASAKRLSDLKIKKGDKTYFFDLYEYSRFFNQNLKGHFLFGDIKHVPSVPSLVKSRPISNSNENSVLLKWNKV